MGVKDVKELWEKLATPYSTKLQLIFDIREDLLNLRHEDCEGVGSYVPRRVKSLKAVECTSSTANCSFGQGK